jgi:indole-3-glycerol phosphate synthase
VLAEAHNREELDRALGLEAAIVGVNSRDLRTLRTDPATASALAADIPADRRSVAESGLRSRADIRKLAALGYDGFLIGEALMRAADPAAELRSLLGHDTTGKGDGT